MSEPRGARGALHIEGELYLRLEVVAELYEVSVVWLREAVSVGLLRVTDARGTTCVAAAHLDRVATIVRLHHVCGGDLDAIALQLD